MPCLLGLGKQSKTAQILFYRGSIIYEPPCILHCIAAFSHSCDKRYCLFFPLLQPISGTKKKGLFYWKLLVFKRNDFDWNIFSHLFWHCTVFLEKQNNHNNVHNQVVYVIFKKDREVKTRFRICQKMHTELPCLFRIF